MADYLVQADLTGRFGGDREVSYLTDTEATGVPDTTVLDEVIDSAEGAVNIRLAARYETPVSSADATTTAAVKKLALDIADVYLRLRKPPITDDKQRQLDQALETLKAIAEGEFVLPGAAVPESTAAREAAAWSSANRTIDDSSARIFTRPKTDRL